MSVPARRFYLAWIALCSCVAVATCLENFLFIVAMVRRRRQLKMPHKAMLVLSIADFLASLTIWPLRIYVHTLQFRGLLACTLTKIAVSAGYAFAWTTVLAIFVITMERYLAIAFPYFYERRITFSRLLLALLLPCCLNIVLSFLLNIWLNEERYWVTYKAALATIVVFLAIAIGALQGHVTYIANRTRKRISNLNAPVGQAIGKMSRAMKSAMWIMMAFLIAYMPFACYYLYVVVTKDQRLFLKAFIKPTVEFVALSNSMLNPIVYYWRSAFVRRSVKTLICQNRNRIHIDC